MFDSHSYDTLLIIKSMIRLEIHLHIKLMNKYNNIDSIKILYNYLYIWKALNTNNEYLLVDGLSFKLPGSGQYVVDRRNCTFQTDGGNSHSSSSGCRVLKCRLNGEGWLDPPTVRLMFDVMNTDSDASKTLKPLGYCHGFVRGLRISVRGQIVEDIQVFDRVSHMFNMFENPQTRLTDLCKGFG